MDYHTQNNKAGPRSINHPYRMDSAKNIWKANKAKAANQQRNHANGN